MYRLWEKGKKVVIPYLDNRNDPLFTKLLSNLYYAIMNNLSEVKFPKGGADIFLADREIIDIFNNHIHPKNTSTIIEVLRLGFDPAYIPNFADLVPEQAQKAVGLLVINLDWH